VKTFSTLVVDTSYLFYRTFFGLAQVPLESVGQHLLYGFLAGVLKLVKRYGIKELIITFDKGHKYKTQLYPDYKKKTDIMEVAQRAVFVEQFKYLVQLLAYLGIKRCFQLGVEADDIIAYICLKKLLFKEDSSSYEVKDPILVVTGDHDLWPLLTSSTSLWQFGKKELFTVADFQKEFAGLSPSIYHEIQALTGCPGDKVPGVGGIGNKRATILMEKYGSLQNIFDSTDNDRLVTLVQKNKDLVDLSYKLAAFEEVSPALYVQTPNFAKARKLLFSLEADVLIEEWDSIKSLSNF